MPVPIRSYRDTDQADVLRIWEAASRQGHPFLTDAFLAEERENLKSLYLPRTTTWVADAGGPLGFVSVLRQEIGGLFVDPAHMRTGVGRALVAHVLQDGDLTLEVFERNTDAQAFYTACGFRVSGGRVHEETGEWLIEMSSHPII